MNKKEKEYWEMSLKELVSEWGDNDMSKYDERQGYPMEQSQTNKRKAPAVRDTENTLVM